MTTGAVRNCKHVQCFGSCATGVVADVAGAVMFVKQGRGAEEAIVSDVASTEVVEVTGVVKEAEYSLFLLSVAAQVVVATVTTHCRKQC